MTTAMLKLPSLNLDSNSESNSKYINIEKQTSLIPSYVLDSLVQILYSVDHIPYPVHPSIPYKLAQRCPCHSDYG